MGVGGPSRGLAFVARYMTVRSGVLQVTSDCVVEKGGIAKAVLDYQRALGGEILSFTQESLVTDRQPGITHRCYPNRGLAAVYGVPSKGDRRRAEEQLRTAELVVIHGLYRYHAQWAAAIARTSRVPYWVVPHGGLDPYVFSYRQVRKRYWMTLIGNRLLRDAEAVVLTTRREAEKASPFLGESKVRVVALPVPPIRPGEPEVRGSLRNGLGITDDDRLLLFLGRLHPMKRVLETIEAVGAAAHSRVRMAIVGPSSEELSVQQCIEHAEKRRVKGIYAVGPVYGREKEEWLTAADGFVSLSHRENFNYAAAEAMAAGLPVILSPGNDLGPALVDVGAGWLLGSLDTAEAARAIREFGATSAEDLRRMGRNARNWIEQNASEDQFAANLAALRAGAQEAGWETISHRTEGAE